MYIIMLPVPWHPDSTCSYIPASQTVLLSSTLHHCAALAKFNPIDFSLDLAFAYDGEKHAQQPSKLAYYRVRPLKTGACAKLLAHSGAADYVLYAPRFAEVVSSTGYSTP